MTVKYDVYISPYMNMYRCMACGDVTDQTDHKQVCGKCGGKSFREFVGYWEGRFRRRGFLAELIMKTPHYDKKDFVAHEKKNLEQSP